MSCTKPDSLDVQSTLSADLLVSSRDSHESQQSNFENISLRRCQRELTLSAIPGQSCQTCVEGFKENLSVTLPEVIKECHPTLHPKIIFNDDENEDLEAYPSNSRIDDEISALRLASDMTLIEKPSKILSNTGSPFLKASIQETSKRRSPVTVQEWVASLPPPETFSGKEDRKDSVDESLDSHLPNISSGLSIPAFLSPVPRETDNYMNENDVVKTEKDLGSQMLGDELMFGSSLRRLSKSFEAIEAANRDAKEFSSEDEETKDNESEDDQIQLGEEAATSFKGKNEIEAQSGKAFCSAASQPHLSDESNYRKSQLVADPGFKYSKQSKISAFLPSLSSLECRRLLLLQSHEQYASVQSNLSIKTVSSIESVFLSRAVDPAELLIDLGFGGSPSSTISRIPARFFATKSYARGISVEEFLKKQEELTEKFDSGFNGYRGLNGSSSTRPSKLVEKIIEKIRSQDRVFRRQWSNLSAASLAGSSGMSGRRQHHSLLHQQQTSENQNIPARFRTVVQHAWNLHNPKQDLPNVPNNQNAGGSPVKKFRAVANSVLSPANRRFMADQARKATEAQRDRNKRRIVIGGQAYSVDDEDLSVTQVEKTPPPRDALELEARDVVPELGDEKSIYRRLSGGPKRAPPISMLHKQDSMASVTSSCSVESDWSDEEKEKLIRAFDDIQERSSATEKNELAKVPQIRRKMGMRSLNLVRKGTSGSVTSIGTSSSVSDDSFVSDAGGSASKPLGARLIFSRFESQSSEEKCDHDDDHNRNHNHDHDIKS